MDNIEKSGQIITTYEYLGVSLCMLSFSSMQNTPRQIFITADNIRFFTQNKMKIVFRYFSYGQVL